MSELYEIPLHSLEGEPTSLAAHKGKALLIVNVASKCGFTPQYEALQRLHEMFEPRGFSVLGFPCNQFLSQEPGTPQEIREFCSMRYGVTFPLFSKVEVNGPDRHPLYKMLVVQPDAEGQSGDVWWNFEKFLIGRDGGVVGRFRTQTVPDDPVLTGKIEAILTG